MIQWWSDLPLLIGEVLLRNLYWRSPALRRWRQRRERRRRPIVQECQSEDLRGYLESIGVKRGALAMLHSRVTGLRLLSADAAGEASGWRAPKVLLSLMIDLLGPTGTLAMVTNAKYQQDTLQGECSPNDLITYEPQSTPCSVGLVNELFWRSSGVKRSLHPYNMLAACGPLADELLRDNLNERKPSAHGVDSGYYRFCQLNGLVISIGVPLRECLTLVNVVPEVRPNWPIKDFLVERRYRVVQDGVSKEWTVRLERENYAKYCHCRRKMGRDLVSEGVIHEGTVGTLRVDWASASEVYDFFWRKTEKRPYPYYALWLARF